MRCINGLRICPVAMLPGLLISLSAGATVVFNDGVFNDADWTMTAFGFGGGGSAAGVQVVGGGNPEAYRQVTDSVNGFDGTFTAVHGYSLSPLMIFNPAVDGAITGIDYSYDYATNGAQVGVALALKQHGSYFFSWPSAYSIVSGGWGSNGHSGLTAADFALSSGSGSLDFSVSGAPIEIGFMTANSTPYYPYIASIGIDNFSVTLRATAVPEPGAMGLLLTAGLGLLARRRA